MIDTRSTIEALQLRMDDIRKKAEAADIRAKEIAQAASGICLEENPDLTPCPICGEDTLNARYACTACGYDAVENMLEDVIKMRQEVFREYNLFLKNIEILEKNLPPLPEGWDKIHDIRDFLPK
ncbi:MAG: hypothetical protein FWB74_06770 [Defluviitaleaceae bacterium]|nr:hypothetical protein [Defluviitaleaceae bacterium]